ncbi:hypothetical protein AgCh_022825 [Apium graveolens]
MVLKERSVEKKQANFVRLVKVFLSAAVNFHINAFTACAGRIGQGSAVMPGFVILPQVYPVPGKQSSTSAEKGSIKSSTEFNGVIVTRNAKGNTWETNGAGQMGRIDEDVPCDFVKTNGSNKST